MTNNNDVIRRFSAFRLHAKRHRREPADGLAWLRYMAASDRYRRAVNASAERHPAGAAA